MCTSSQGVVSGVRHWRHWGVPYSKYCKSVTLPLLFNRTMSSDRTSRSLCVHWYSSTRLHLHLHRLHMHMHLHLHMCRHALSDCARIPATRLLFDPSYDVLQSRLPACSSMHAACAQDRPIEAQLVDTQSLTDFHSCSRA